MRAGGVDGARTHGAPEQTSRYTFSKPLSRCFDGGPSCRLDFFIPAGAGGGAQGRRCQRHPTSDAIAAETIYR